MVAPQKHSPYLRWGFWLIIAALAGALVWFIAASASNPVHPIEDHLADRGRIAVLAGDADVFHAAGTSFERVEPDSALGSVLAGEDEAALAPALLAGEFDGLLILGLQGEDVPDDPTVLDRLRAYHHVAGLRGVFLSPDASLYRYSPAETIPQHLLDALAVVARRVIAGERLPREASFPEPLREAREVEVVVILAENGEPRLWRSARGRNIARALLTAASVARQRWEEREGAMDDDLDDVLPRLDIEVALLEDDGTFATLTDAWLHRAVTLSHGIGFEQRGFWRYLLPDETRRAGGGLRAYEYLLAEGEKDIEYLERPDVRTYRFVVRTLARSMATTSEAP